MAFILDHHGISDHSLVFRKKRYGRVCFHRVIEARVCKNVNTNHFLTSSCATAMDKITLELEPAVMWDTWEKLFIFNRPFAVTGHMVQNPPYWMAKERGILHWDIENKGKSGLTGWNSFVYETASFFYHPIWRILYHVTSYCKRPIVDKESGLVENKTNKQKTIPHGSHELTRKIHKQDYLKTKETLENDVKISFGNNINPHKQCHQITGSISRTILK